MNTTIKTVDSDLVAQEQLYRLTFENTALGMAQANKYGQLINVNNKLLEITGYSKEELLQKTFQEITHPDDLKEDIKYVKALYKREIDSFSMEKRYIRKDGGIAWVNINGSAVFDSDTNEFRMFISVIEDISEKKRIEQALRENEQRFKIASSAARLGTFSYKFKTGEEFWSPEFLLLFGLREGDVFVMKDGIPEAVHPDDREGVLYKAREHYERQNGPDFNSDHRIVLPDGSIRWLNVRAKTEFDDENKPLHTYGIAMDITERVEAEKALMRKNEENAKLLNIMPAAVWISEDENCDDIRGNRMANEFYEADKDENVSANSTIERRFFRDGIELKPAELPMQRAARENIQILNEALDVVLPSGKVVHMHGSAIPLNNEKGEVRGAIAAFVDITKHKKIEKALLESEEKFRNLANNMSQLAWMMDEKGWVFWFNKRWYEYTGTTPDEMQGWGWQNVHHPDQIERVLKSKKHCIESGEVWEELFPLRSKYGEYRWFLTRAIPIKDEEGRIIRWLGTNTDLTDQREYEMRLEQDNKLFEDLLYIAMHDLKGPVANLYAALNLMSTLTTEKKLMFLDRFWGLADQLNVTIEGITDILKVRNTDQSAASDIIIEDVLNQILTEFKNQAQFSIKLDLKAPSIHYIKGFLYSIIRNLISNSVKYCRSEVPLEICISTEEKDGYKLLCIKDNGKGIDLKEHREKLFLPFKRLTSSKVKGTGIGLYLIKDIIEKNDGKITVESKLGEGTTFYCYLKEYKKSI